MKGYTLMEFLAVISIVAIVASIAVPNAVNFYANMQASAAAKEFIANVRYARNLALSFQQPVRFKIVTNYYRIDIFDPSNSIEDGVNLDTAFSNSSNWTVVTQYSMQESLPKVHMSCEGITDAIFITPRGIFTDASWSYYRTEIPLKPVYIHFCYNEIATVTVTINGYGVVSSKEYYEEET